MHHALDDFETLKTIQRFLFFSYRRGFARIEGNLRLSGSIAVFCFFGGGIHRVLLFVLSLTVCPCFRRFRMGLFAQMWANASGKSAARSPTRHSLDHLHFL